MMTTNRIGRLLLAVVPCLGCAPMSESVSDAAAGWNGGFETMRDGLPVNWLVYSPETVAEGRFALAADTERYKEGTQSLRFDVEACSPNGGRHSPGLTREVPVTSGMAHRIRFWIASDAGEVVVTAGGVDARTGSYETLYASNGDDAGAWHQVERIVAIGPEHDRLRFELSVRSPGRVWIDDVRIEPLPTGGGA